MKNSRNQIKKPRNQTKKSEFCFLSCNPYSQTNCQETTQETAKKPKLKNWQQTKNPQSLVAEGISQETRKPKSFQKNSSILMSGKQLFYYARGLFSKKPTAPPPLHGGYIYPPWMEWRFRFFSFQSLQFYQQKNLRKNERNSKREIQRRTNHRNF